MRRWREVVFIGRFEAADATFLDPIFITVQKVESQPCREKGADELYAASEAVVQSSYLVAVDGKDFLKDHADKARESCSSSNDDCSRSRKSIRLSGGLENGV